MALLPSITPAQVEVRIKFSMFFDRAGVAAGISKAKRAGLYKAGSVVMQIARRSIEKKGMARPKLKVMTQNEGRGLRSLASDLAMTGKRRDYNTAEKLLQRAWEIKFKPASRAPKPPHTHGGQLRKSITFAYDPSSESVVIGGFMQGIPQIVSLHEFGGTQRMQAWAWVPQEGSTRRYTGIIGWWAVGRSPYRNPGNWKPMGPKWQEDFVYPARPYMQPALMQGITRGRIPRAFGGSVNMTGMPGT